MAALAESVGLEHFSLAGLPAPVTLRLPVPLSDDELIAFSHRNRPYRIERSANGELEIMSPLGGIGDNREVFAMMCLGLWAEQHGGLTFSSNVGFTLSDGSVRSSDACWLSELRWNALSDEEQRRYPPICPEFLIEILSESDRLLTLECKMDMWMANGAQLAWMIDPYAATVSIYRPGAAVEALARPDWVEADSVVTGFRLETSRLWAK